MAPVPRPVSAHVIKKVLEAVGYRLEQSSEFNWTMYHDRGPGEKIINIPRKGSNISLLALDRILEQAKISNAKYLQILRQLGH